MKQTAHRPGSSARRAFTLVEILVVVGIIALLAALAFPVFSRVRETGRRTSCTNNLRQLGLAFQQYLQDSSGRYPLAGQYQIWADGAHWITGGESGAARNYTIPEKGLAEDAATSDFAYISPRAAYPEYGALFPYTKSVSTYVCPSAKSKDEKRLSYSMNCAIAGLNSIRIKRPNEIVLLVDEGDTLNDGFFYATNNSNSTDSLFKGHNGGGNILLADGSVKFFNFDELPLDWNSRGLTLKSATSGEVRFRDNAFGTPASNGSNYLRVLNDPLPATQQNTCLEPM